MRLDETPASPGRSAMAPRAIGKGRFAAALFDMDGLLIDSERAIMAAWLDAARALGRPLTPDSYAAVVGRDATASDRLLAETMGGMDVVRAAREHADRLLSGRPPALRFPLKAGAATLLRRLASLGVPCALASSSARDEIEARLHAVGVRDCFRAVAGGDEVAAGKPDPAVYRLAAERAGLRPDTCLAFEDSPNGARAALASGAALVLVPDLVTPPADLAARSLHVLGSLDEAVPLAAGWFGGLAI